MWLITEHARYTANAGEWGEEREWWREGEKQREERNSACASPGFTDCSSLAGMGFSSLP